MSATPPETSTDARRQPAISFAIPYYGNIDYLREAIVSVINQTCYDWELIIVDDAGPEPADELIAEVDDPRIQLHRNHANLGLAGNWNTCIRLASAPWVTLLHADDRLASEYGASVLRASIKNPDFAAIFTDASVIDAAGRPARSLPESIKSRARRPTDDHDVAGDTGLASILVNNYIMCPTLCYRTDLARRMPFDDRWRMVMDLDHTAQMLLDGYTLHGVRRPLYEYRRHRGNQSSSLTANSIRFEEEIALYRELADRAESIGWTRTALAARRRWMVRANLALHAATDVLTGHPAAGRRKISLLFADVCNTRVRR